MTRSHRIARSAAITYRFFAIPGHVEAGMVGIPTVES